jgi:ATP-dependent helicase/nuclease subunit A
VANSIFEFAVKQNQMKSNPMKKVEVRIRRRKNRDNMAYTTEELEAIFHDLRRSQYYSPCYISLMTGLRLGEVCGLRWKDVCFDTNRIRVKTQIQMINKKLERVTLKSESSEREIVITPELKRYLLELKLKSKKRDSVCENPEGGVVNPRGVSSRMHVMKARLGIDCQFHRFRHTHATLLMERGINIKVIQERLGHSTSSMTLDIYSHVSKDLEEREMAKFSLDGKFGGKVGGTGEPLNIIAFKNA